jgi:hypothetical protein
MTCPKCRSRGLTTTITKRKQYQGEVLHNSRTFLTASMDQPKTVNAYRLQLPISVTCEEVKANVAETERTTAPSTTTETMTVEGTDKVLTTDQYANDPCW